MFKWNVNVYTAMGRGKHLRRSVTTPPLHKVARQPGRGVRLTSQTKHIVENVRKFFEKEKTNAIKKMQVVQRLSQATDLSEKCLRNIHNEYVSLDSSFFTPVKRYTASRARVKGSELIHYS